MACVSGTHGKMSLRLAAAQAAKMMMWVPGHEEFVARLGCLGCSLLTSSSLPPTRGARHVQEQYYYYFSRRHVEGAPAPCAYQCPLSISIEMNLKSSCRATLDHVHHVMRAPHSYQTHIRHTRHTHTPAHPCTHAPTACVGLHLLLFMEMAFGALHGFGSGAAFPHACQAPVPRGFCPGCTCCTQIQLEPTHMGGPVKVWPHGGAH